VTKHLLIPAGMFCLPVNHHRKWSPELSDRKGVIAIACALGGYSANWLSDTLALSPLVLPVTVLIAWSTAPLERQTVPPLPAGHLCGTIRPLMRG
jgi:hypothetical protein